jgi:hypothetical protein
LTVALREPLVFGRDQKFRQLWRKIPLELADALQFRYLRVDPFFQLAVPFRQLPGLDLEARRLFSALIVQHFDPQHRFHARHQGGLIDGFGEVFLSAGIQPDHDIFRVWLRGHQDDRYEGQIRIVFQAPADLNPIHLGHHDVEDNEVRRLGLDLRERFHPVAGRSDVIAVHGKARLKDIQIGRVIVCNQDLLALSQRGAPVISGELPAVRPLMWRCFLVLPVF